MGNRIYITQEMSSLDYSNAEQFGELVPLTRDDVSSVKDSLVNAKIAADVHSRLAGFTPELDYVLFSGSPMVSALVFMELGKRFDKVRVLRWSNRDQCYAPVTITTHTKR